MTEIVDPFDALQGTPDLEVIARDITAAKKRLGKPVNVDLALAISGCKLRDTMQGSSALTIGISDQDLELFNSGFFDSDENGHLDPIDLQYGTSSSGRPLWWRLTQCGYTPPSVGSLIFMERPAVYLMHHRGPVKASRAKRTRAEFIGDRVGEVKAGGGIRFHSKSLHKTIIIDNKDKVTKKDKSEKALVKDPGINIDEDLKIQGVKATPEQLAEAETALHVANQLNAPELAVLAMGCAGIGESGFKASKGGGTGGKYVGVFQGQPQYFKPNDTAAEAKYFLKGGKGFGGGGAIAQANAHPDKSPGLIAADTEVSYPNKFLPTAAAADKYYSKYIDEAKALIAAYGGGGFTGTVYTKQYNFEIGNTQNPHEDYWDGINALAEEVRWPFFLDGNDAYYDPETELIKQQPAAVISRTDPAVVDWGIRYDDRGIATEMTLELVCDMWQFRAGLVFKLAEWGPATAATTAKLPGRWLISDVERDRGEITSHFTLKQPQNPRPEPASEQSTRQAKTQDDISPIDSKMTPKDIIDQIVLPIARENGIAKTPAQNDVDNRNHHHLGEASDHAGPPAVKWAADIGNGFMTQEEAAVAEALAKRFDLKYTKGVFCEGTHDGFRYQLIHGANFPPPTGDHRDHVHFGARRVGA